MTERTLTEDRRAYPRLSTRNAIVLKNGNGIPVEGVTNDLCEGGFSLALKSDFPMDSEPLQFELQLPVPFSPIKGNAKIIWKAEKKRTGFAFQNLTDDNILFLDKYINRTSPTVKISIDRRFKRRRKHDTSVQTETSLIAQKLKSVKKLLQNRVVITGIGVVAPNGVNTREFWEATKKGISGIKSATRFEPSPHINNLCGEITNFDFLSIISAKKARHLDRSTLLALMASNLAIDDANLRITPRLAFGDMGVFVGTAMSGIERTITQAIAYHDRGYEAMSPFAPISCFEDACSGQVSIHYKLKGPSVSINTGCAAGTTAIALAVQQIREGKISAALAGGADAPLMDVILAAFSRAKAVSEDRTVPVQTPRPFDRMRDGILLAEGSGFLILEDLNYALKRNAKIYAEIVGYGRSCDAYRMVGHEPSGHQKEQAIWEALEDANLKPQDVNYINAHGTGTKLNDSLETRVIKNVFGKYAKNIPISSTKSMLGHTQGASGAIELAVCALAIRDGVLPPTINYSQPDPECDLDYIPNVAREKQIDVALSNSFAFGGKNEIVILKRFTS